MQSAAKQAQAAAASAEAGDVALEHVEEPDFLWVTPTPAVAGGASDGLVGVRPLLLFLSVLLAAFEGSSRRPAAYQKVAVEYREASLALLIGYAGHPDLPPHEVISLLPAWPLQSLAGYLTRCARRCLHEQRYSMLE